MKKIIILSISFAVLATGLVLGYIEYNKTTMNSLLMANLEILAHAEDGDGDGGGSGGEGESSENTRALWSNAEGTRFCCGPGNVRPHCDGTPDC